MGTYSDAIRQALATRSQQQNEADERRSVEQRKRLEEDHARQKAVLQERWADTPQLLEQWRVRESLEAVRDDVWRKGFIQLVSSDTRIGFRLIFTYGEIKQSTWERYYVGAGRSTFLEVGLQIGFGLYSPSDAYMSESIVNGHAVHLFVEDSSSSLEPVVPANQFNGLAGYRGWNANRERLEGIFKIPYRHPQAEAILNEMLTRSCIHRALNDALPENFLRRLREEVDALDKKIWEERRQRDMRR